MDVRTRILIFRHTKLTDSKKSKERSQGVCLIPVENTKGIGHPLYIIWKNIRARCYQPGATGYKYYGGRGIHMCASWLYSFDMFVEDMGERPDGHSVDRINNDGNYSPHNCRWTTDVVQANNQGMRTDNKSGVVGVSYIKNRDLWLARVRHNRRRVSLGVFPTVKAASESIQRWKKEQE
jgi:hypothetical protein